MKLRIAKKILKAPHMRRFRSIKVAALLRAREARRGRIRRWARTVFTFGGRNFYLLDQPQGSEWNQANAIHGADSEFDLLSHIRSASLEELKAVLNEAVENEDYRHKPMHLTLPRKPLYPA